MTIRRKKMQKVLELREQTLHERAGVLSQAHEGRAIAQEQATNAAGHLEEAAQYRQRLATAPTNVASWIDAEQWLAHRNHQNDLAQVQLQGAETLVMEAYDNVIQARSGVKRIELLDRRMASDEVRRQSRSEQKASDEHSQRRFMISRRLGTD
jgi:flagellar export protein FliJ